MHKIYRVIALLTMLFLTLSAAACMANPSTGKPVQTNIGLATAQGGNMHYQNLVLSVGYKIVFTSSDGDMILSLPDGTDPQTLIDLDGSNLTTDTSVLYFLDGLSSGNLVKVSLDGTNSVRIGQTTLKYLFYHDSKLYAIESESGQAIRMDTSGAGRESLLETQAIALTMADNRLFVTGVTEAAGLTMIDLATDEQRIVLTKRISSLNVSGDWLYFADPANGYRLSAWSLSHNSGGLISKFGVEKPFILSDQYIYYIDNESQNRVYRLKVDGDNSIDSQTPELVVDDAVNSFVVNGYYVFYQRPNSSRIYRVDITGKNPVRIT